MFANMGYLKLDVGGLDDKDNQNIQVKEPGIINIGGFMTMNVDILDTNEDLYIISELEISLGDNIVLITNEMYKITNGCKEGGV
jgi:hypothetical protein